MIKNSIPVICLVCVILAGAGFGQDHDYLVSYDKNGFPHIEAGSELDALYGQGYEMARAQGYLLYHIYIKAVGKWAKYYHPGPDPDLAHPSTQNDYRIAVWQLGALAKSTYHDMDKKLQGLLQSFCMGINDAVRDQGWADYLPANIGQDFPQGIEPWHVVAAYMRVYFKSILDQQVYDLPFQPAKDPEIPTGCSNAWTFLDEQGVAWLQVDPHSDLGNQDSHMTFGCKVTSPGLRWCGFNFLGMPLMGAGVKLPDPRDPDDHAIGWTVTMAATDMADLYEVEWNGATRSYYMEGQGWKPLCQTAKILIEFNKPENNLCLDVYASSDHGPMVKAEGDKAYFGRAVWQVHEECANMMKQWYHMLTARNLNEFRQALAPLAFPGGNLIVATSDPDDPSRRIAFFLLHPTPDRTGVPDHGKINWSQPVNGSQPENIWNRAHSREELPAVDGGNALGQRHFINCNSTIDCTYAGFLQERPPQPFTSWPAYLVGGFNMYSHRQERAQQIWDKSARAVDWSFMYRMSMDKKNGFAVHNLPDLFAADDAWHDYAADPGTLESAMQVLKGWDRMSRSESEAMYLFKLWVRKFIQAGAYSKYFTLPSNRPAFDLHDSVLCLDALNALIDAYSIWLTKTGPGERSWGHNHRITRQVTAGMKSWPVSGDSCCLRSAYGPFKEKGPGSGKYEDHIEVEGGQIIPMIIRMNLSGPPLIRYMKAIDNCTVHASRSFDPACPSTVDWVEEVYGDL